jgi:2-keto-4-pentenoate hydratase/2-oxohepta-3-ene-1,7-dioic acid hydratase in catechol pathway
VRIANKQGRLTLLVRGGAADVETASGGRFGADPQAVYDRFDEFREWASGVTEAPDAFRPEQAGPPAPLPKQVFAVALNYRDHAAESGFKPPDAPLLFPKYVSAFSGPVTEVVTPEGSVDWEVEVVAVIGRTARHVRVSDGWDYVAGLTVGQDLSERQLQRSGPVPQFGLAKSFPGFAPMGPALVTPDELERPDDLGIGCEVNGESMQKARTSDMIFSISELVAYLSGILTLYPGDVIFTGTPPGVGMGRKPPRFLKPGDRLHSWVEGLGELDQHFVADSPAAG